MIDRRTALTSAVVFGLGTLSGLGGAGAQEKVPAPVPPAAGPGRPGRRSHPHMRAAMQHLRQAAQHLELASHTYGGHRAKALDLVKQAEEEMKLAAEYVRSQQKGTEPKQ